MRATQTHNVVNKDTAASNRPLVAISTVALISRGGVFAYTGSMHVSLPQNERLQSGGSVVNG